MLSTEFRTRLIEYLTRQISLDDLSQWAIMSRKDRYSDLLDHEREFLNSFEARLFELQQKHITEEALREFFVNSIKTQNSIENQQAIISPNPAKVAEPPQNPIMYNYASSVEGTRLPFVLAELVTP